MFDSMKLYKIRFRLRDGIRRVRCARGRDAVDAANALAFSFGLKSARSFSSCLAVEATRQDCITDS